MSVNHSARTGDIHFVIGYPAGIWCENDVASTSMRRHHVASTLIRRYFRTKCPLGSLSSFSSRNFEIISRYFDLIFRNFEIVSQNFVKKVEIPRYPEEKVKYAWPFYSFELYRLNDYKIYDLRATGPKSLNRNTKNCLNNILASGTVHGMML